MAPSPPRQKNELRLYEESDLERLRKDVVAIDLFRSLQEKHPWLDVSVLPVGGAADHKLLYVLSKVLVEHEPRSVIEFGAGQSSRILDAYSRQGQGKTVTVEHDAEWARTVSNEKKADSHRVVYCPLKSYESDKFGEYAWYNLADTALSDDGFQLFLIDGPVGTDRFSRVGIVDHFHLWKGREWGLIWDDLQRPGDLESSIAFLKRYEIRSAPDVGYTFMTSAAKILGVAFTERFASVNYYF